MKIGRNEPCPCGSGLKYKKCCMEDTCSKGKPKNPFDGLDKYQLLQTFSSLTLVPENADKLNRIEEILDSIMNASPPIEGKSFDINDLSRICNSSFFHHPMDDPLENCFSEIVTFKGIDYIVFPGINEGGTFYLQHILNTIFLVPSFIFPEEFKAKVERGTFYLLTLSNYIASKLGVLRYEVANTTDNNVTFPDLSELEKIKTALIFPKSIISKHTEEDTQIQEVIGAFSFDNRTYTNAEIFQYKPLFLTDTHLLVISPTTLIGALTLYIGDLANEYNCSEYLETSNLISIWHHTILKLRNIGFLKIDFPDYPIDQTQTSGFFQFDEDKIAYIYFKDSNNNHIKHFNWLKSKLLSEPELSEYQILEIEFTPRNNLIETLQGQESLSHPKLVIPIYEFNVFCYRKNVDALLLWKFASLKLQNTQNGIQVISTSFLDEFKFYIDQDYSFYLSDNQQNNFLLILTGTSNVWRQQYKLERDEHTLLKRVNEEGHHVKVEKLDRFTEIYKPTNGESDLVVTIYSQPIWVSPNFKVNKADKSFIEGITHMVAFWIAELSPFFREPFSKIKEQTLTVSFDFQKWPLPQFREKKQIKPIISINSFNPIINAHSIHITIPENLIDLSDSPNNEIDREVIKVLYHSFIILANHHNIKINLDVEYLLRTIAPLGQKSMFTSYSVYENILLAPIDLKGLRLIQYHDVNLLLDKLPTLLGDDCLLPEEIPDRNRKRELLSVINQKVLLPLLRERVQFFNHTILLERLIRLNEELIYKRESLKFELTKRIACSMFDHQSEIEFNGQMDRIDKTSIALRCLIEQLSAEQVNGSKLPSMSDIDELIAIMNQIMVWGTLSDQIHYNLKDEEITLLPSGRIGTEKSLEPLFRIHLNNLAKERRRDIIHNFQHTFDDDRGVKDLPIGLDEAFKKDYGISFSQICMFIEALGVIGLKSDQMVLNIPTNQLQNKLNEIGYNFSNEEYAKAIDYLTLEGREFVDKPSLPFTFIDIIPWRFNRKLSLLYKPLIKINISGEEYFTWGTRQLFLSRLYLDPSITSGRFRCIQKGAMDAFLGKQANARGNKLVKESKEILNVEKGLKIETEVQINKSSEFYSEKDLGDVDILVIDTRNKIILSLECKSIAPTRNLKEIYDEYEKLYTNDKYIKKHLNRHEWLEKNKDKVSKKFNLNVSDFEVHSIFVTAEPMFTPLLKGDEIEMPFISQFELESEGYLGLLKKIV